MSGLTLGEKYSRRQIHDLLGGNMQEYLPAVRGKIVAGCFRLDLNPSAPERIYPGTGRKIQSTAHKVAEQRERLPIFLKRGNREYEFMGYYLCTGLSATVVDLQRAAAETGRTDITGVLRFARSA